MYFNINLKFKIVFTLNVHILLVFILLHLILNINLTIIQVQILIIQNYQKLFFSKSIYIKTLKHHFFQNPNEDHYIKAYLVLQHQLIKLLLYKKYYVFHIDILESLHTILIIHRMTFHMLKINYQLNFDYITIILKYFSMLTLKIMTITIYFPYFIFIKI